MSWTSFIRAVDVLASHSSEWGGEACSANCCLCIASHVSVEKGSLTTHAVLYIQLFHIELLLGMQLFLALHVGIEHAHIHIF